MRFYVVIFLVVCTSNLYSQSIEDPKISVSFIEEPLEKVLLWFHENHNLQVAFDNELVSNIRITAELIEKPLSQCLPILLQNTSVEILIYNDNLLVVPRNNPISSSKRFDFKLSGIIQDENSGETLPNALIRIKGTSKGTVSNIDGFFSIMKVPTDTSTLIIEYLGYQSKEIKLSPDQDLKQLRIPLQTNVEVLKDVTITDRYDAPIKLSNTVSKVAFNPRSLSNLPSLGEQDLFRNLQYLPGVSGTNESSSGLVIRGSLPSHNLILLDGFTIYHLDHFFGIFSAINADVIKDVQIYKGGFDSKYGGRISGVVDMTGKSGSTLKPSYSFGANLVSFRGTAELPLGKSEKVSLLLSLRRAYTDVIQSSLYKKLFDIARRNDEQIQRPIEEESFEEIEPSFYFYDFNSKLTYRPTEKDILSLSIYSSKDNLFGEVQNIIDDDVFDFRYEENINENTEWGNNGLSIRWGRQWNDKYYSNIMISGADFFKDYNLELLYQYDSSGIDEDFSYSLQQNNKIEDATFNFHNEITLSDRAIIETGLNSSEHKITYKTVSENEVVDESTDEGKIAALYFTGKFDLTEKLNVSAGWRMNYHEINQESYIAPRVSLRYKVTKELKLKAAAGQYYQFINQVLFEDPLGGNQSFWAFSNNEGVPVVKSNHQIVGATYSKNSWTVDVEGYYKDAEGLVSINLNPLSEFDTAASDLIFFVDGRSKMRGLDFMIQKESGKHTAWLAYSLGESLISYDLIDDGEYYPSLQDQRHEFKLINMLSLGKWQLASTWIFGSGTPYPKYEVTNINIWRDYTNKFRLPSYHRLDISAAYSFKGKGFNGQVGLSIFNVYGRKNIKNRKLTISEFDFDPSEDKVRYRDLVLINFTPSIFFNISF